MVETVDRDDLAPLYLDFVNRAIHDIALLHSFEQMKAIGTGTVTIGQTRAQLPADFKELQDGRYPIFDSVANTYVPVFTRPEIEKLMPVINQTLLPDNCYIYTQDFTGGVPSFNLDLPNPDTVTHTVTINYFAFPAIQTDPTQTTPLITFFFELVLLKALSIAFESINDPQYMVHENQFMKAMQQYMAEDLLASEADISGKRT
jgi:hypothetical protein